MAGFAAGTREVRNRTEPKQFLSSPRVRIHPINELTAEYYARLYGLLRRKGHPIPTNDLWIAATALQYGLALYSYDAHFGEIDGLICGDTPETFFL